MLRLVSEFSSQSIRVLLSFESGVSRAPNKAVSFCQCTVWQELYSGTEKQGPEDKNFQIKSMALPTYAPVGQRLLAVGVYTTLVNAGLNILVIVAGRRPFA